jgi:hypothetical protein
MTTGDKQWNVRFFVGYVAVVASLTFSAGMIVMIETDHREWRAEQSRLDAVRISAPWRREFTATISENTVRTSCTLAEATNVADRLTMVTTNEAQNYIMRQNWLVFDRDTDGDGRRDAVLETCTLHPFNRVWMEHASAPTTIYDRKQVSGNRVMLRTDSVTVDGITTRPETTP